MSVERIKSCKTINAYAIQNVFPLTTLAKNAQLIQAQLKIKTLVSAMTVSNGTKLLNLALKSFVLKIQPLNMELIMVTLHAYAMTDLFSKTVNV